MPPKAKPKSRIGSAVPKGWEEGLHLAPFGEENVWMASIALVVNSQIDNCHHVETLGLAINGGSRKLFSYFSRDDLFSQAVELGVTGKNAKSKSKDSLRYQEVCEVCKAYIDNGDEMPLPLLARLIKFRLLAIKDADCKRREAEKKAVLDKAGTSKGGKGGKDERDKSPAKGAKGAADAKKGVEQPSPKTETKLKKRGEAELDAKFINDEPDDGPQHYVVMSGFYHPHLLTYLAEIGITVDCIIRVEGKAFVEQPDSSNVVELDEASKKKHQELEKFWQDILPIMDCAPEASPLLDVARLNYIVDESSVIQPLPEDGADDAKAAIGAAIFDDIAVLLYNLSDAKRHWKNYLANLKLINIPDAVTTNVPPPSARFQESAMQAAGTISEPEPRSAVEAVAEVDMRYYNELMNTVPLESTSIALIMHCMLEQVCVSEENRPQPADTPHPPRSDGLNDCLAQHLSSIAFKLALSDEQKRELYLEFCPPPVQPSVASHKPLLISYHDDMTRRLNHLKPVDGFNTMKAELDMLGYTQLARSLPTGSNQTSAKVKAERAARFQKLLRFCSQHSEPNAAEITHALRQFVFECMDLTSVNENGVIDPLTECPKQLNIPYDDPYPYYVGMIPSVPPEDEPGMDCSLEESSVLDSTKKTDGTLVMESEGKQDSELPMEHSALASSGSILKRQPSSGMRRSVSSAHSVHFEHDSCQLPQQGNSGDAEADNELLISEWCQSSPSGNDIRLNSPAGEDLMTVVNQIQKRNFDPWCFAEHMEPHILLQAMLKALEIHACADVYYHRREQSFLVVLHSPFHEQTRHSSTEWHIQLHSNVHFRNYLEHVAGTIVEWTQQEEAKYQAALLAAEVERLHLEEMAKTVEEPATKRDRSKSPKKSASKTRKTPPESPERVPSQASNPLVRAGSIKAWKEEQERLKLEQEEQERLALENEARRAKSRNKTPKGHSAATEEARVKTEKADKLGSVEKPGANDKKHPEAKASGEHTSRLPGSANTGETDSHRPSVAEAYWPFVGYNVGSSLIHASGTVSKMFPSDGGQIETELLQFVQGSTNVKTTIRKDGHTFVVHVVDPLHDLEGLKQVESHPLLTADNAEPLLAADGQQNPAVCDGEGKESVSGEPEGQEKQEEEEHKRAKLPEKLAIGRFGSFTAQFRNGMAVALSTYGPNGEPPNMKRHEPEPYVPPPIRAPSSNAIKEKGDGKGGKKGGAASEKGAKDKAAAFEPVAVEEAKVEPVEPMVEPPSPEPFQQLYVSCPDGLAVTYFLESSCGIVKADGTSATSNRLLVRQHYPIKTRGTQNCEAARRHAMEEVSRVITADGTVIRTLLDGSVQVLFADGTVSTHCQSSPLLPPVTSMSPEPVESGSKFTLALNNKKSKAVYGSNLKLEVSDAALTISQNEETVPSGPVDKQYWITTLPSGERTAMRCNDNVELAVPKATVCIMSDPQTSQVMHTRDDKVITVYYPDNTTVVEHADGTRIMTVMQEVRMSSESADTAETGEVVMESRSIAKLVMVECPGFASVKFDAATGLCSTEFSSGCNDSGMTVECLPSDGGSYMIFPSVNSPSSLTGSNDVIGCEGEGGGCCLRIDSDGTAVYYPHRPSTGSLSKESTMPAVANYYVMRHFDDIIVETIDTIGCHYVVTHTGDNHVGVTEDRMVMVTGKPDISVIGQMESSDCEAKESDHSVKQAVDSSKDTTVTYDVHAPRLFTVNRDGSGGTELLRQYDVSRYLLSAEQDPGSIVLTEPLPDCSDVMCITVLRRTARSESERWLRPYTQDSIVPLGLRSSIQPPPPLRPKRSLHGKVGDGEPRHGGFGTRVGRGLNIGTVRPTKTKMDPSSVACPSVLEVRQLLQFKPVSEQLRSSIEAGLKAYADRIKEQMQATEKVALVEPRSHEEQEAASQVLYEAEKCKKPPPVDTDVDKLYVKAMTCGYIHTPPATPEVLRKKYDIEKAHDDVKEEMECRLALRDHRVPPYFDSDIAACLMSRQTYDKRALADQVWGNTSCDGSQFPSLPCEPVQQRPAAACDGRWSAGKTVTEEKQTMNGITDALHEPDAVTPFDKLYHVDDKARIMEGATSPIGCPVDDAAVVDSSFPTEDDVKFAAPTGVENFSQFRLPETSASVDQPFAVCPVRTDVSATQCVVNLSNSASENDQSNTAHSKLRSRDANSGEVEFKMLPVTGKLAELFSGKPGEIPNFVTELTGTGLLLPSAPTPIPDSYQNWNRNNSTDDITCDNGNNDARHMFSLDQQTPPIQTTDEATLKRAPSDICVAQSNDVIQNQSSDDRLNRTNSNDDDSNQNNQNNGYMSSLEQPEIIVNSQAKPFVHDQREPTPPIFINDHAQLFIDDQKFHDQLSLEDSLESRPQRGGPLLLPPVNTASLTHSLVFDATGQPRTAPVPVPAYLHKTARPGATPNTKFSEVEEPVRRKVHNITVTGATVRGSEMIRKMRGLSVLPDKLDFGVLKEGCTYSFCASLQNTGIDACRFRVRQPPPGTGIKVLYSPGPVAAGMKTELNIEIFAIAAGVEGNRGVGCVSHSLEITTETDNLMLPITATVLTANEFDNRSENSPRGSKAPGVRLVSSKPIVGIGVIRPERKKCQDIHCESVEVK